MLSRGASFFRRIGPGATRMSLGASQQQSRSIVFARDAEHLKNAESPTLQQLFQSLENLDQRRGRNTLITTSPSQKTSLNHFDPITEAIHLPTAHPRYGASARTSEPVVGHEVQHAVDEFALDIKPVTEVLERRAFTTQKKIADELNLPDGLGGMTPAERARQHIRVRKDE